MNSERLSNFRPLRKKTLRGFCDAVLGPVKIHGVTLHEKNGSRWVGFPSRPYQEENETKYARIVSIPDDATYTKIQEALVAEAEEKGWFGQAPSNDHASDPPF